MRRLVGCGFGGAMIGAPFVALLFDVAAGLAVMVLALSATTYLAIDAVRTAEPVQQGRLRGFAVVNAVLVLICLAALIVQLN